MFAFIVIIMKKYAINYGRSFPDHRVPVDFHFNRELMKNYSSYFRVQNISLSLSRMDSTLSP